MRRIVLWKGLDSWRAEVASLEFHADAMVATGTQIGVDPLAYRLDYRLETGAGFITQTLSIDVTGEGWTRQMRLARGGDGTWSCHTEGQGDALLPPPGGGRGGGDGSAGL